MHEVTPTSGPHESEVPSPDPPELPFLEELLNHISVFQMEPEMRYLDARRLQYLAHMVSYDARQWMRKWAREHPQRTHWDMLPERTRRDYEGLKRHINPECHTCGADISTEALFWQHYIIPDVSTPNMGWCPHKDEWAGPGACTCGKHLPTFAAMKEHYAGNDCPSPGKQA